VAEITFVPTASGFLYLAVVLDAWSRKIVGWAMATHIRAELVMDALEMAIGQRRPADVIHHSDQGSFASQAEAKMACFSFIEGWYNPVRLHSALGYLSPKATPNNARIGWGRLGQGIPAQLITAYGYADGRCISDW